MDTDGIPVVGAGPPDDEPTPRRPGMITAAVSVAILATVTIVVGLDRETPDPPRPPDGFSEMTTTTARFSVEQSALEWRRAAGLEEATAIREVVRFADSWVAVGSTAEGIGVWQLDGPREWRLESKIDVGDLARVTDAREVQDHLAVTAVRDGVRSGGGLLSLGTDGLWAVHHLDNPNPNRSEVVPTQVSVVDETVIVSGYAVPDMGLEEAAEGLPEHLASAVEAEDLSLHTTGGGVFVVTVAPGIEVATFGAEELGTEVARPSTGLPLVWSGERLSSLDVTSSAAGDPFVMMQVGEVLVGETQSAIVTSDDGRSWSGLDLSSRRSLVGSWADRAIISNPGSGEFLTWSPGSSETEALAPADLIEDGNLYLADGDSVGVVALGRSRYTDEREPETTVATTANGRIVLTSDRLEKREAGEVVDWISIHQAEVTIRPGNDPVIVFTDDGDPFLTTSLRHWLRAMEAWQGPRFPASHIHVAHSSEGVTWSVETWEELSGSSTVAPVPTAHAAEDFLLVVDDAADTEQPIRGAFMAYPGR